MVCSVGVVTLSYSNGSSWCYLLYMAGQSERLVMVGYACVSSSIYHMHTPVSSVSAGPAVENEPRWRQRNPREG